MTQSKIYLTILGVLFAGFAIVFDTFPRSEYSVLEKRELAHFPQLTAEKYWSGVYADSISSWFSDTEPFRDWIMELSMTEKDWLALKVGGDENVTFHASTDADPEMEADAELEPDFDADAIADYENNQTANDKAKVSAAGIIVVGTGDRARALMAFGGSPKGGVGYAETCNKYKQAFPDVNVYCMVVPSAAAFYTPEKAKGFTRDQLPVLKNIWAHLEGVKPVDIYTPLGEHADEDIYLRTDHHWSPLGAYYAARKLCEVAGVPFKDLSHYEKKVVHGFVGSMYGYSKDIAIKNAPEDFVYYVPKGIEYTTTYTIYTINENYQVTGEGKPHQGQFFCHFKDGSSSAYCTFMGGDTKLTVVRTGTKNGRRLIILKDSYGNALPGYLFYSFEEIHVIDARYFTKNMKNYVHDNHITDIVFANNIFKAYGGTYKAYLRFLEMRGGAYAAPTPRAASDESKPQPTEDSDVTAEPAGNESTRTEAAETTPATPAEAAAPVKEEAAKAETTKTEASKAEATKVEAAE